MKEVCAGLQFREFPKSIVVRFKQIITLKSREFLFFFFIIFRKFISCRRITE